nr:DUF6005 family protein [uncultured Shinella sp.]
MSEADIIAAIRTVLAEHMNHPHLAGFAPEARLNEDLYLDSVLILQIFLNLELEFGLSVPEEIISRQDITTVADLAGLLARGTVPAMVPVTGEGVHGELDYDIKVHCFVSCLCDGLKKRKLDHRPFYFGIWDTPFAISERAQLLYHGPGITQDFFKTWFERLYGVAVEDWYDATRSKEENIETLLARIAGRPSEGSVMVMLDMFHLPERENKFNQNPFPHYLMLETSENPAMFSVLDPDYRWEGEIARETVLNAVRQPTVAGGYAFDGSKAHAPDDADVRAYFEACFRPHDNPLADRLRAIVRAHLSGRDGLTPADLPLAVRELPVITIRKYAYEHGLAYFWRALKLPAAEFDPWCDEIEALIQLLKTLHYDCMKLGQTADATLAAGVLKRIDEIDAQEFKLKRKLGEIFDLWCAQCFPVEYAPEARRAAR